MAGNKEAEALGRKVLELFTYRITDEIFQFIEKHPELLEQYREAVKNSSAHGVNAVWGKMITEAYDLENLNKETNPESKLLKKYTRHGVRWDKDRTRRMAKKVMYGGEDLFSGETKRRETPVKKDENQEKTGFVEESLFSLEKTEPVK